MQQGTLPLRDFHRHLRQNQLLVRLDDAVHERLSPHLEPIALPVAHVLSETGRRPSFVYFPTGGVISLMHITDDGDSTEIALVGNEGMIGVGIFLGGNSTLNRAVVQSTGSALRLRTDIAMREFARGEALQQHCLLYAQAMLTQVAQTAVCNRHHRVEQQLCRWLLLTLDRLESNELPVTHELIADALGVRRECITQAVGNLQRANLIHCQRKQITVVDRAGIEAKSCECYATLKNEIERLLPDPTHAAPNLRSRRPALAHPFKVFHA